MAQEWIVDEPEEYIRRNFPGPSIDFTSPQDNAQNCIGFALGERKFHDTTTGYSGWPRETRGETINHLIAFCKSKGFILCETLDYEPGFDKIVLFEKDDEWTHACCVCEDGLFKSKESYYEDFKHTLEDVLHAYGRPAAFMKKPCVA